MIPSKQVKETQQGSFTPVQDGNMIILDSHLLFSFLLQKEGKMEMEVPSAPPRHSGELEAQ